MEENKAYLDANEFEVYDDIDEIETKILGSTVFADLLSDAGFKTIFTCRDNEDLLVDLINVMLQGERTVKSIKLKPTEFVPGSNGGKKSVVDLCAVDDKGVSFDLEVQRCSEDDLFKRFMGYASRIYYDNLKRGGDSSDLKPVYVIILLAGEPKEEDGISYAPRLYSSYTMMEKSTHELAPATICIIFAALAHFDKKQLYTRIMLEDFRTKGMIKAARREGREEGREEAVLQTAQKLLQAGVPADIVAKCTNLDLEKLRKLSVIQ